MDNLCFKYNLRCFSAVRSPLNLQQVCDFDCIPSEEIYRFLEFHLGCDFFDPIEITSFHPEGYFKYLYEFLLTVLVCRGYDPHRDTLFACATHALFVEPVGCTLHPSGCFDFFARNMQLPILKSMLFYGLFSFLRNQMGMRMSFNSRMDNGRITAYLNYRYKAFGY